MAGRFYSMGGFAKLSRSTRATLHHYDNIGLLSPVSRGKNKYRYYSSEQLSVVNLIQTLQTLGVPLDEVKKLRSQSTPEQMAEVLTQLIETIEEKIRAGRRAKKLLLALQTSIRSALNLDEEAITIQYLPQEAIVLGNRNDYSDGKNEYDALLDFYHAIKGWFAGLSHPVWGIFSGERIKRGDWHLPDRYYFCNPDGHEHRPAALYAIGYARGGYGQTDDLYKRVTEYIDNNGYEICGNAYEEYPLNELCITDDTNYLIRVLVTVREKKQVV